jgi:hypothetical protein
MSGAIPPLPNTLSWHGYEIFRPKGRAQVKGILQTVLRRIFGPKREK